MEVGTIAERRNEILTNYNNLEPTDMTAMLIASYVYNAPLLGDMNALLHMPLILVNGTGRPDRELLEKIGIQYIFVDSSVKKDELIYHLKMKSSKALIVNLNRIHTSRSVKEKEKFEILAEVAESGIWREYQCGIVPLFLCSPSFDIDNLFEGTYFFVEFAEMPHGYVKPEDLLPRPEDLGWIEHQISRLQTSSQEERALKASACFTLPKLSGEESVYKRLQKMAESILLHNNNKLGCSDLDMAFISDLRRYVLQEGAVKAYRLPVLEQEADMDNSIFFAANMESFYVSQTLFCRICDMSLTKHFGLTQIKRALEVSGALICHSRKTYTDKMSYRNTQHEFMRKNMLRFRTQAFDDPRAESILQLCEYEEEKTYEML